MKVFVAGASGAIGRSLVPQLVAAGHDVTGTTRSEQRAEMIRAAGTRGDLRRARRRRAAPRDRRHRLASEPAVVIIAAGEQPTAACPGSVADPQAAPGTFCIYENPHNGNTKPLVVCDAECSGDPNASRFGAELFVKSYNAGRTYIDGSWAVTAH